MTGSGWSTLVLGSRASRKTMCPLWADGNRELSEMVDLREMKTGEAEMAFVWPSLGGGQAARGGWARVEGAGRRSTLADGALRRSTLLEGVRRMSTLPEREPARAPTEAGPAPKSTLDLLSSLFVGDGYDAPMLDGRGAGPRERWRWRPDEGSAMRDARRDAGGGEGPVPRRLMMMG